MVLAAGAARLVLTSFLALFAVVGLCLYGLPFYYDDFIRELGWSRADVMLGDFLSKLVVNPLLGFPAGWLIERAGPRRPLIAGILCAGLALVCLAGVTQHPWFVGLFLLNALGYLLGGPLPNQVLLARRFQHARGRAMGLAYLGIGAGGALAPLVSQLLVEVLGGWRPALRMTGVLVVVTALPLVLWLRDPDQVASAGDRGGPMRAAPPSITGALATPSFLLVVLASMLSIGAVQGAYRHLKLLFTLDQGRPAAEAALLLSVLGAVSLIGRVGAGWLADRFAPKRVMVLVYLLVAAATALLASGAGGAWAYPVVVLLGLGLGGEYLLIPLLVGRLFGTARLGRLMGIVLTADGIAEALFPWLVGRLHDRAGSYQPGFHLLAVTAAAGAVLIALVRPARTARQTRAWPQD